MQHITDDILRQAILAQGPVGQIFDSHDVIEWVSRSVPQEYTRELNRYEATDDPILNLHRQIGRRIATLTGLVRSRGKVSSTNIGGKATANEEWERV